MNARLTLQRLLLLSIFLFAYGNYLFAQTDEETLNRANRVYTSRIDFHFNDSTYQFRVFIKEDGEFYFKEGLSDSMQILYGYGNSKDTIIKKTDSILNLCSFFPQFIIHDSSIINHLELDFMPMRLIYELEYSYLLNNLNESKIHGNKNLNAIRVIYHENVIRLEFGEKSKLFYTSGKFDSISNYHILATDSCILSEKEVMRINKILQNIDFDKEYYFTAVGNDEREEYLIEYQISDKYYVFQRHLSSPEKKEHTFTKLIDSILKIKGKYIKNE